MNPKIPADYAELGRWLEIFATSHAKREDSRFEAALEMNETREGRSYGLRLVLGAAMQPAATEAPLELGYAEVAAGRTRFAWCNALAERLRGDARQLAGQARAGGDRSA